MLLSKPPLVGNGEKQKPTTEPIRLVDIGISCKLDQVNSALFKGGSTILHILINLSKALILSVIFEPPNFSNYF